MKRVKLSRLDKTVLEDKLKDKYKEIGSLKVHEVKISIFPVNNSLITTVKFYYGFLETKVVEFRYDNEELFIVAGEDILMRFIEEMKPLLKEYKK